MRYELYSLKCNACGARNAPTRQKCAGCAGTLSPIRRCPKCQNENPPNAYVCISCYVPLREKPSVGVLHWHIPWSVSLITLVVVVGWTGYSLAAQWFNYTEAQIEASAVLARQMELQHREYEQHRTLQSPGVNYEE